MFKLKKPNFSKEEQFKVLTKQLASEGGSELFEFARKSQEHEYLYWDKIQYKEPSPKNISKEDLWMVLKFIRESQKQKTVITDNNGIFFSWIKLGYFEKFFHDLDMNTGGELFVAKSEVDKANKQKLITRGIMEEAIASSQLEGAATSRQAAKKMLREGRQPRNRSEQMIVNNYVSMKAIEDEYKNRRMDMDLILELHGLITKDTTDSEDEAPHLRKKGDPIVVSDEASGVIYHEGPDTDFVKKELKKFIAFANDELDGGVFVHPVIKAIMLHFWMGYLHPFTDGNGRLARLLFYWYLIKKGYWAFVYLPISKVIKKSPMQYIMAYVYTEQDDNDLTYFIDYNIKKIYLALKEFNEYLEKQSKKNSEMKKIGETKFDLNMRQVQLLQYLHGDPETRTSLRAHMNVNQVSKMTASKDLKDLVKKKFLVSKKQGKNVYYFGTGSIGSDSDIVIVQASASLF